MSSVTQNEHRSIATGTHNTEKYEQWSIAIIAVLVAVVYAAMFGNYRVNVAIDTPWDL